MNKNVGGRGKKSLYESTHVRVPLPIKDRVEELKQLYINGALEHYDQLLKDDHEKARLYENSLTGFNNKANSSQNSLPSLDDFKSLEIKLKLARRKAKEFEQQLSEAENQINHLQNGGAVKILTDKIRELELKNHQMTNSTTTIDDAITQAKNLLKQKKSARESVAKLLTSLYDSIVTADDLSN